MDEFEEAQAADRRTTLANVLWMAVGLLLALCVVGIAIIHVADALGWSSLRLAGLLGVGLVILVLSTEAK